MNESDRAFNPEIGPKCIVYLNGDVVEECVTADEELRFVEVLRRDKDGKFVVRGNEVMTKKLYGKVQIELPDERARFQRLP